MRRTGLILAQLWDVIFLGFLREKERGLELFSLDNRVSGKMDRRRNRFEVEISILGGENNEVGEAW